MCLCDKLLVSTRLESYARGTPSLHLSFVTVLWTFQFSPVSLFLQTQLVPIVHSSVTTDVSLTSFLTLLKLSCLLCPLADVLLHISENYSVSTLLDRLRDL